MKIYVSLYFLDGGTLLIGTDTGLNYYDFNNGKFSSESKLKNKSIINIKELNGEILFFTNTGIYKKTDKSIVLHKSINFYSDVNFDDQIIESIINERIRFSLVARNHNSSKNKFKCSIVNGFIPS